LAQEWLEWLRVVHIAHIGDFPITEAVEIHHIRFNWLIGVLGSQG
jgi:hypothetical protein